MSKPAQLKTRRIRYGVPIAMALYIGSYVVLSIFGKYEPVDWDVARYGRGGVTSGGVDYISGGAYQWGPLWFTDKNYQWNKFLVVLYAPVWETDKFYWHTPDLCESRFYPVNRIIDSHSD